MPPTDLPPIVLFGYDCEYDELGEGGVERMCLGLMESSKSVYE
jgi:hypothetical protein